MRTRRRRPFLALGDRGTEKDYSVVVVELVDTRSYGATVDVLEARIGTPASAR